MGQRGSSPQSAEGGYSPGGHHPVGAPTGFLPSVVPLNLLFNTEISLHNTHKQIAVRMPTLVTLSVLRIHLASV